jgi:hypothetical protein
MLLFNFVLMGVVIRKEIQFYKTLCSFRRSFFPFLTLLIVSFNTLSLRSKWSIEESFLCRSFFTLLCHAVHDICCLRFSCALYNWMIFWPGCSVLFAACERWKTTLPLHVSHSFLLLYDLHKLLVGHLLIFLGDGTNYLLCFRPSHLKICFFWTLSEVCLLCLHMIFQVDEETNISCIVHIF